MFFSIFGKGTHLFYISNTFVSNAMQKLSNTLRLNFSYSKIIRFLHTCYPKIIGDILKNVQKQARLFKRGYMIDNNENKIENEKKSHRYDINRPRPRHGNEYGYMY